ncbi:MAG TPA: hypothetical protein VKN35_07500, partial [Xanthomonadales bacterium]|nr:hypothetical protein [Xanthomonadales bacterium]
MFRCSFQIALSFLLLAGLAACGQTEVQPGIESYPASSVDSAIIIGPVPPADIAPGAFEAGLEQASSFAWSQFISMHWLAVEQTAGL